MSLKLEYEDKETGLFMVSTEVPGFGKLIFPCPIQPKELADIVNLGVKKEINHGQAKKLLDIVWDDRMNQILNILEKYYNIRFKSV